MFKISARSSRAEPERLAGADERRDAGADGGKAVGQPAWKAPFLALEERDFRRLWLGLLPWTLAVQMGMVTTGYVAYDISGSATAVGVVSLGWGMPMLAFGLFGGVVADRFPKRRTLLMTQ
ncbi:MAG: MFS transporter, partial [Vicinamibacterales bacterium]